ncbi:hypothetical protein L843_5422 [Mycobacterium intracellulare MIN_061107_1834]|nr:hypothetical protein L843_5422 [Mycobacterium intracellulare MIN_061107_1834]
MLDRSLREGAVIVVIVKGPGGVSAAGGRTHYPIRSRLAGLRFAGFTCP